MAETILRVIYDDQTYDLELKEDIPLRLDVSAVEVGSIGDFFGVGSQSFTLPGTEKNNRFFKHAYNIGADDVPAFYNTITAYIIYDGETLLRGQFLLTEVITDEGSNITYNCQLTDDVVRLKDNLANQFISQADWSEYNHTISSASIIESWDGNLLSGSVFYPVAEYGDQDEDSTLPRIGFSDGGPGKWFDKSTTPLLAQQLVPAIRARDVMNVIINQIGFRATGSFFDSPEFDDVYVLPKAKDGVGFTTGEGETATCLVYPDQTKIPLTDASSSAQIVPFKSTINKVDPFNVYDSVNSYYSMDELGEYEFQVYYSFFNPVWWGAQGFDIDASFRIVHGTHTNLPGTVIDEQTIKLNSSIGFNGVTANLGGKYFNTAPGEQVWVELKITVNSGNLTVQAISPIGAFFKCSKAPINYEGSTVDMSLQWPSDLRSYDVVSSLIKQFNLVFTPDYDYENTINVKTFDQWMLDGRNVDWTNKFNSAERVSISHTVDEIERELIFTNDKDSDRFSKITTENEPGDQYGTLRLLADNNISQGQKTIKNGFAPLILASSFLSGSLDEENNPTFNVDFNSRFAVPHLYKFENNRLKSFKFKPRIGFRTVGEMQDGTSFYFGNPGEATQISGSYTTISNVQNLPVSQSVTKDLHFNNSYGLFASPSLLLNDGVNNYESFWKLYTDSIFWEDNRKVKLDVQFAPYEYKDIRLNDHIFIKDQQYRINKISGYNVSSRDVVNVELLKLYPAYYTPTIDIDCTFVVSGSYSSNSCPANVPVPVPAPTTVPTSPTPVPVAPVPQPVPAPVSSAPSLSNGWQFSAGEHIFGSGTVTSGFHRGTIFGCPSELGFGQGVGSTTSTTVLPGDDCYSLGGFLSTKGYGINGVGTESDIALTQFYYDSSGTVGTGFFMSLMDISTQNNIGTGTISGTWSGTDGTSGTWTVDYIPGFSIVDNNGAGSTYAPESYGEMTLTGLSGGFVSGIVYTIEVT